MVQQKQRPKEVVWEQFTQTPNTPVTGNNPVTKVLNMELAPDKSVRTRAGFSSTGVSGGNSVNTSDTPENQIVTSLLNHDKTLLIYKDGSSIKYWDGDGGSGTLSPGGDINYSTITPDTPTSFAVYGGELYVCESAGPYASESALFAWDGATVRNLGVPGMTGEVEATPTICSARNFETGFGGCGYGCMEDGTLTRYAWGECLEACPDCEEGNGNVGPCDGIKYLCNTANPGFSGIFCWSIPTPCEDGSPENKGRGEKILNCAFKVGLYDSKRNIFGRACDPRAVIKFGPNRGSTSMYQYQIKCEEPSLTGLPDHYQIAVWCTTPVEVMEFSTYHTLGSNDQMTLQGTMHAMSEFLGGQMFLEGIFNADGGGNPEVEGCTGLCLYKDQVLLANSKPYSHTFDRPVPSKAMCILGDTAIYFHPIAPDALNDLYNRDTMSNWNEFSETQYENLGGEAYKYGAEFSVGHPEQIGRYTDTAETSTALPYMKGDPVCVFNDGGNNMLLTRQGLYAIGFNRGPQVQDLGGPGIITSKSYHPTSSGVMYVGDEGPVWLQGGKAVSIIRTLGFDGWIDDLNDDEKEQIRIGLIEDSKKVLCYLPVPGENGGRGKYIMHDVESSFTSEWWVGSSQDITKEGTTTRADYMSSFRSDFGYRFLLWHSGSAYRYNDTTSTRDSLTSMVEMWINEGSNYTKQLNTLTLDFGDCLGDIIVKVDTFDNPLQTDKGNEDVRDSRSLTLGVADREQRTVISRFMGMRGKFFRIQVYHAASTSSKLHLMRVHADFQYDDNPMPIGETILNGDAP